ncbi:MAG: Asp-tRNA(Asn)/Glu-tRNA(Gln) amidotransferase subunit GatB [Candidatus Paceibacterota bacterium]
MTKEYTPTIGLEIHAELATKTKMFCRCLNNPDAKMANAHVCPVCMGHPGTLPTINKEAVKSVLKIGLAVGGALADKTNFDRKNYFYPDIPKAYQISQYKRPLVSNGSLAGVALTRIHLEEDTARSSHDTGKVSLVDFNRSGLPLMELVTEPVIKSGEEAMMFATELQLLLRTLGVAHANMEKGEMRVEANISVSNSDKLGVKVEVKNLNSFKSVGRAIDYEIKRHRALLSEGKEIIQETRGWDEVGQKTFSQRSKENAHDYRYFPDPDLPPLELSKVPDLSHDVLRKELPELPWVTRERYINAFGMSVNNANLLLSNRALASFTEEVSKQLKSDKQKKLALNYVTSDLVGLIKKEDTSESREYEIPETITVDSFVELIEMIDSGDLSSRGAKDTLSLMYGKGGSAKSIAESNGFIQKNDIEELTKVVKTAISENKQVVEEYLSGKESALQFLVGQCMKATKGTASPPLLIKLLKENIK